MLEFGEAASPSATVQERKASAGIPVATIARLAAPRVAPRNDVPWRIVERDGEIELQVVRLMEERLEDSGNAGILLACGGVLENMRIALNARGFVGDVTLFPDPTNDDVLARVRTGESRAPGLEERALFRVLEDAADAAKELGPPLVDEGSATRLAPAQLAVFHHAARSRGCWIDFVSDEFRRGLVSDLVARAATLTEASRGSRPLFSLFSSDPVPELTSFERDPYALETLFALLGSVVRPSQARTRVQKTWPGAIVMDAPLLAIVGSGEDTPKDWLYAGGALQRVLLHATIQHLSATFFMEPLRHALVRDQLRSVLFATGYPHALVRFEGTACLKGNA